MSGDPRGAGQSGDDSTAESESRNLASADEVIKVADLGFVTYEVQRSSGHNTTYLSYGYVIENVSDEVALSVRVSTEFFDESGKPTEDHEGHGHDDRRARHPRRPAPPRPPGDYPS